ncbi:MAG: hypothetical protein Q9227_005304 [Pyrenula ochraceoflavens]
MQPREILDVIELVYYVPALVLAGLVCYKHGLGRQLGWVFLVLLSLLRIIGASTGIANYSHPSKGLSEASNITYNIGLSPLIMILMGVLKRVNEGIQGGGVPPLILDFLNLPSLAGIILGIIGGTRVSSSDTSKANEGWHFTEAAVILFLAIYIVLSAVTAYQFIHLHSVKDGERRLVFAAGASLPFFLVRFVYSLCASFDHNSKYFSFRSTANSAVILQAILSLLMEFIIVAIFISVGFVVPKIPRDAVRSRSSPGLIGMVLRRRRGARRGRTNGYGNQQVKMAQQGA